MTRKDDMHDPPQSRGFDLRREERVESALALTFEDGSRGMTRNVSAAGLYIETDQRLPLGGPLAFMVDFVGRYERLGDDFATVAQRLKSSAKLLAGNTSEHAHYSSYYTAESAEIVRQIYQRDISTFQYSFESIGEPA